MIIVVFEFLVFPGREKEYFSEVKKLQNELHNIAGFISVDRYIHNKKDNYYASISSWENEEAVNNWNKNLKHNLAQKLGKNRIFKSYRIRVANVLRDYNEKTKKE